MTTFDFNEVIKANIRPLIALKRHYFTFGYFVVRKFLPEEVLKELAVSADALVEQLPQPDKFYDKDGLVYPRQPIFSPVEKAPILEKTFLEGPLFQLVEFLFDKKFYFFSSHLSYFRGSSTWHKDTGFINSWLKINVYLDHADHDSDGSFKLIPGSHVPFDRFSNFSNYLLTKVPGGANRDPKLFANSIDLTKGQISLGFSHENIMLGRGDVLFFDTRLIHTAFATERRRRLIGVNFFDRGTGRGLPDFVPTKEDLPLSHFYRARVLCDLLESGVNGREVILNYPKEFYKRSSEKPFKKYLLPDLPIEAYNLIKELEYSGQSDENLLDKFFQPFISAKN